MIRLIFSLGHFILYQAIISFTVNNIRKIPAWDSALNYLPGIVVNFSLIYYY